LGAGKLDRRALPYNQFPAALRGFASATASPTEASSSNAEAAPAAPGEGSSPAAAEASPADDPVETSREAVGNLEPRRRALVHLLSLNLREVAILYKRAYEAWVRGGPLPDEDPLLSAANPEVINAALAAVNESFLASRGLPHPLTLEHVQGLCDLPTHFGAAYDPDVTLFNQYLKARSYLALNPDVLKRGAKRWRSVVDLLGTYVRERGVRPDAHTLHCAAVHVATLANRGLRPSAVEERKWIRNEVLHVQTIMRNAGVEGDVRDRFLLVRTLSQTRAYTVRR
jgi:hypothetical protein